MESTDQAQSATAPDPAQAPDVQLFSAGQTIELLSQLLGATLRKLAKAEGRDLDSPTVISQEDVNELEGHELQHGDTLAGIAIRVAPIAARPATN